MKDSDSIPTQTSAETDLPMTTATSESQIEEFSA
jgi:hypothetical protein